MKTIAKLSILVLFSSLLTGSCKKEKLDGDYSYLVGTWTWIGGWSDGGSEDYKLELLEKGKYKLYKNNEKVESGRLVKDGDNLKFLSNNYIKKLGRNYLFLHKRKIFKFPNSNTITIKAEVCCDFPSSTFVKR